MTKAYRVSLEAAGEPAGLKGSEKSFHPTALDQTLNTSTSGDSEATEFYSTAKPCWALPDWREWVGGERRWEKSTVALRVLVKGQLQGW